MFVDSPLVYIYSIEEVQIFRRQIGRDEPLWLESEIRFERYLKPLKLPTFKVTRVTQVTYCYGWVGVRRA